MLVLAQDKKNTHLKAFSSPFLEDRSAESERTDKAES